jgi:hypothetical protein
VAHHFGVPAFLGHWKLTLVWAWIFFALNTTMTTSIIYKILSVSLSRSKLCHWRAWPSLAPREDARRPQEVQEQHRYVYNAVVRVIIESSFVSWVGLLAYTIATTCFFTFSNRMITNSVSYLFEERANAGLANSWDRVGAFRRSPSPSSHSYCAFESCLSHYCCELVSRIRLCNTLQLWQLPMAPRCTGLPPQHYARCVD